MRNAYVSLLSSNNYIYAAVALMYSWKNTYSKYPFVLLVTKDISETNKNIARAIGYQVVEIDELISKPMQNPALFNEDLKLLTFSLTQFNKVCFIDLDSLVLQNMDNVFDYPGFSTVQWNNESALDIAFFVIEPNATVNPDIYNYDKQIPSINYYDFGFLKEDNINLLTEWPNLKAIHFGDGCKPWMGGYKALKSELFSVYMEYVWLFYLDILNAGLKDIYNKKIAAIEELIQ